MYGETLDPTIVVGEVTNPEVYYEGHHGSSLIFSLFDEEKSLIARGTGLQWSENYQLVPIMEWGKRHCLEIVKGAMPPGQLNFQSINFLHLNDTLPTVRNLVEKRELQAIVQIASHETPELRGLVIDVFVGVVIQGQQGNWNAQSLYLRNGNMLFRKRLNGLQWLELNPDLANQNEDHAAYPATIGG